MITGVQDVYYNVSDMKRAVRFYSETLGLTVKQTDQWWAALDAGGVTIGLHWSEGAPIPQVPKDPHGAHAGATLTLKSTDIANDRKALESGGAKILGESNQPWGHMLVFEDPDGNILKLMKPK